MKKTLLRCAAAVLCLALFVGVIPRFAQMITKGETIVMEQQKQSDFVYREVFENCDSTDLRCRARFDLNWRFARGDVAGAENPTYDDSSWRLLNLPHDWSIEGEYDQGNPSGGSGAFLPTGVGWYRKTLSIPQQWRDGRRVSLVFDGVYMNSTVYVDGVEVGGREYGWLSFSCDITRQVQGKDSVVVAVKADNSVQPSARWYTGSGIYSHVWVVSSQAVHVAENGVYVITPAEFKQAPSGEVNLQTTVVNDGSSVVQASVRSTLYRKADGVQVAQVTSAPTAVASGSETVVSQTANVADPLLWSVEDPNLYFVKTEVLVDGTAVDDCITEFGFRSVSYDVNGLYLNGVNTELKGVSNHWALGAVGAAQPDNIIRYKILMMKRMGVNCIRTSHNACPPVFYQLCDELGMMVMDELFEGERGKTAGDYGTRFFADHWQEDVEYWIKRDRNHPSVVVWSIGNETGSNNDNAGISAYIKKFDATRPTTGSAIHYGVDIPGANGQSEPGSFTQPVADLPLIATEAPHTHAVRGVYRTQTWRRGNWSATGAGNTIPNLTASEIFKYDWSSSAVGARTLPSDYDNAVSQTSVRRHWTLTRDNDWRIGEFRWTGFDYLGEANYVLGGWPYRMFHSGAVDTALFEKDMYYLYQSMWSETPMLHILPSWTHPTMEEGTEIPVWVYSNCEKVELFLNGVSQGVVDRGPVDDRDQYAIQFDWLVPYTPGTITAVGYDAEGGEVLRDSYVTASAPAGITLENTADEEFPVDASYLGQVTVTTVDRDGNFYPYGENRAYYHVSGPAYIKAADNGSPVDTESHVNYNRNAFMGLNKVFVAPTQDAGDILFTAASILGEKRQLTSNLVSIDVQQLALRGNPEKQTFEIYYTTDGTTPDKTSLRYTGAFSAALETTVKAAVYPTGGDVPMFVMEETFGADEGLFWAGTGSNDTAQNIYPAADAVITGEAIRKEDYGYTEQYINFNGKPGSAEYTVHAQTAGDYYVAVCYNNGSGTTGNYKTVNVAVNDVSTGDHKFFYNGTWLTFWSYRMLRVSLNEGENTVKFTSPSSAGPNLKELILWHADDVYTASEVTSFSDDNDEAVAKETSFDGQAVDVHSGGAAVWTVSGKAPGMYRLRFAYSTPNSSLRETALKVNGAVIAYLSGTKSSPDYGSAWGLCEKDVYLAPGANVVSIAPATGGTLIGGVILEPLALSSCEAVRIDASCVENTRLAAGVTPFLTGTDTTSESAAWDVVTDPQGAFYLVCRENGKLLASDGTALFLADGDADGSARWMRAGEAEHYDYLVHVLSGNVLAVGTDRSVFLDDPENYEDSDMRTNRAYWHLYGYTPVKFSFVSDTPAQVSVDKKSFTVRATAGMENEQVTYAVLSGPAAVDANTGLVVLSGEPGTLVLKAALSFNGEPDVVSAVHSVTVTPSRIARTGGIVVLPGEGQSSNGAVMGTAQGVTYWNFGNGGDGRSVDFTVNAETAGEYYLAICYNSKNSRTLVVTVNGTAQQVSVVQNSASWGDSTTATNIIWSYHVAKVTLKQGENAVVLGMNGTAGAPMFSDLIFWPVTEWLTAKDEPGLSGGAYSAADPSGFDGITYDLGNAGENKTVTWSLTVPATGLYRLTAAYCSPRTDRPILASVGGTQVGEMPHEQSKNSGYVGAWKFVTTDVFALYEGETTVTLPGNGGYRVGGVRLERIDLTAKFPVQIAKDAADTVAETDAVASFEIAGVQVRTADPAGIRFVARMSTSLLNELKTMFGEDNVSYGILLQKTANTGEELTEANVTGGTVGSGSAVLVPGAYTFRTYDDYLYYTAVITGMPASEYDTQITARAYVKCGDTYYFATEAAGSTYAVAGASANAGGYSVSLKQAARYIVSNQLEGWEAVQTLYGDHLN